MPSHHWARDFVVTDDDVEVLTGLLLERETPLSIDELARALIDGQPLRVFTRRFWRAAASFFTLRQQAMDYRPKPARGYRARVPCGGDFSGITRLFREAIPHPGVQTDNR